MRSFWKTSLLFMLLACASLLPANSAAQKKDAPASVIVFPLEYYGPLETGPCKRNDGWIETPLGGKGNQRDYCP